MYIKRSYLEENSEEEVEVINVKASKDKVSELLKQKGFYPAWHMNKKSWITIVLDETLLDDKIITLIDESRSLISNKK